jgi:hypothetical protein
MKCICHRCRKHELVRDMIRWAARATSLLILTASIVVGMTDESARNREEMMSHFIPVLNPDRDTARINIVVNCRGDECPQFPRIELQRHPKGKSGLDAVREVFAKDQRVAVTSNKDGVIQINFGKAPSLLLQTKIRSLRFTTHEQYNIISAEGALVNAKEIKSAIQRYRIESPVTVMSEIVQEPMEAVPRLPREIHDITLDQALDLFARTFGDVMIYAECIRPDGTRCFFINHDGRGGKWFDALRARWDQLSAQGYKTGVCPVHHVRLERSTVYAWKYAWDRVPQDPRPYLPDDEYFQREEKYPMRLPYAERRKRSKDFYKPIERTFCPVCQQMFEAEIKQSR